MVDVESNLLEEAKRHIFTVDADTYRQITGRSLTDVDMELLIAKADHSSWDPQAPADEALKNLYQVMKQRGIENSIGLKLELVGNGQYSTNFFCIAYATGLRQRRTGD